MSRKHKNRIDVRDSIEILNAYGMKVKQHLPWEFMIFPDASENRWDWYHTTGSLVRIRDNFPKKMAVMKDAESVAIFIQKTELQDS